MLGRVTCLEDTQNVYRIDRRRGRNRPHGQSLSASTTASKTVCRRQQKPLPSTWRWPPFARSRNMPNSSEPCISRNTCGPRCPYHMGQSCRQHSAACVVTHQSSEGNRLGLLSILNCARQGRDSVLMGRSLLAPVARCVFGPFQAVMKRVHLCYSGHQHNIRRVPLTMQTGGNMRYNTPSSMHT